MSRIKIIDSPMGTGKTSWAIDYINKLPKDKKIIYITPYISECKKIIESCNRRFVEPSVRRGKGRKFVHFLKLIKDEKDIVATHSLFSRITDELIESLRQSNYTLILDEAFNVITRLSMWDKDPDYPYASKEEKDALTKQSVKVLLKNGFIRVEDDYRVKWVNEEDFLPKYILLKSMCDRDLVYLVNGELLLWTFPVEVFKPGIFENIFILTYLFDYQLQSYYYGCFDVEYKKYHIEGKYGNYKLVETKDNSYELEWKENAKKLLNIHLGPINKKNVYYRKSGAVLDTAFSKSWYDKNIPKIEDIQKSLVTFFANYTNTKSSDRMWTCFKIHKQFFGSKQLVKRNYISSNARATNDYANKTALGYLINRYIDPFYISFFHKRGIQLDSNGFALSEMIQWIWRSAIRNNKPVDIFIPSVRMRNLLIAFLDNENIEKLPANIVIADDDFSNEIDDDEIE